MMETGKAVRGSAQLGFDAVHGVTNIVEGMYRNISATPFPLGRAPLGRARGIAGLVHESIRQINGLTSTTTDWLLRQVEPVLDRSLPSGAYRESVIAALNGVCGDHLATSGNGLAISMQLRVLLPPEKEFAAVADDTNTQNVCSAELPMPDCRALETETHSVEIFPAANALENGGFSPTGRILVLAHGLCMNERSWDSAQHNHAEALAQDNGYTPVYLLYNSGRNISTNGREFCEQLGGLLKAWPVPVDSISFIGFSMGGLLMRSAMHVAHEEGHDWLNKVDKAVYVGTPHHGAVLERGGYWLHKLLAYSPYTAPLSALARIRSAGITDLRYGNVQDADWQHHDEHEENADRRQSAPLPEGIAHYAIAATLSKRSGERIGRLLGDGLVHPSSATGRHDSINLHLDFPTAHTKIFYNLGHVAMLHDERVTSQLQEWLSD